MTYTDHKTHVAWIPAIAGTGLCIGAIALLTADAITTGHLTITHAMQPLLVLGTCIAAAWAHRCGWRNPLAAVAFASLALLGSLATIYGTLGRQADARDVKVATAVAENRQLANRHDDLEAARVTAKAECKSGHGKRCESATARVDALVASMAALRQVSPDPRADAIADLLHLVASFDKLHTRKVVAAIDPIVLPLFLEVGSILFFAAAFPRCKRATVAQSSTIAEQPTATVTQALSRAAALADLQAMRQAGSGKVLADRWGVHPATVSRWLAEWQSTGEIARERDGKAVKAIAGPARRHLIRVA